MEDMPEKIRVIITDDHAILREGLISLIEKQPDILVIGEAEDGEQCLERAQALHPDVIVLDLKIPGISGIEACRQIKASLPETKVVILSMYEDYEYVNRALQAGADGYLLKKVASSELVSAIRRVRQGEKAFSSQVLDMIVDSIKEESQEASDIISTRSLTAREFDVLSLMSEGMSNKEIAARLFVSPKTVEKMITSIYRKLKVSSRTAAVKLFLSVAEQ